jgi:DNA (cytosine-5)-methyltransferase 1
VIPAYYNEFSSHQAQWLRNLANAGEITPGDVDERDIRDVLPIELLGYRRCHFFAGVGAWDHALALAGWPVDRPVWSGSCPCQSFSQAGRRKGFADERHLWPAWFHLIRECRPPTVFGEQVAAPESRAWLDLVHDDLEALGYAVGAVVLPAACVGAPHGRHRIFFVADAGRFGRELGAKKARPQARIDARPPVYGDPRPVAESLGHGRQGKSCRGPAAAATGGGGESGAMGDAHHEGREAIGAIRPKYGGASPGDPAGGFWADAEWLPCRDGKLRATQPGLLPLVDGPAFRLDSPGPLAGKSRGRLIEGYGNAIVPPIAAAFVRAFLDISP